MNATQSLIAAIALTAAAAGSALAQEATPDTWLQAVQSGKTRAAVSAELATARQTGLTKAWSAGYMEPVRSHATRAAIKAQTAQAIQSGELKAINAEVDGYTAPASLRVSQASR
ncbi:MAG: hypothetical protein A3E25_21260 [Burkholderiales bacterium RIFCSPHIGHO2_12_FULL_69_20]|nr:MAG: hypothetical protein A3E25_21260 [Burkholderiales bacterium RIFCSPHIGHO2_12_FULL_69_20]